mmetsp:Transcript_22427/g.21664  ORF Transcript_22427/g.21664 Transcript_22427/m.21664 type:complete len:1144 (+) Transcript_22427:175-3606(+)|eukprot:CAMPEP_0119047076 /NCGR_PEP_ID=MMETSP1177-20130426/50841_1 /TAXON_ID=2985 /ORGANISM="Ochromonas sp, Strain CCMP1899" /LENGTH=1143 /DNA_ID=CAMNT_0007021131 /DNA_START=94 /DNA_END=3525 /DNA_ORIENTATION=+
MKQSPKAVQNNIQGSSSSKSASLFKEYKWFNSHCVLQELHCGICRLDLPASMPIDNDAPNDLWISARLICHGMPTQDDAFSTPFAMSDTDINAFVWNSLMNFHMKIKDLANDAAIIFTAWTPTNGSDAEIYGTTTFCLFDSDGRMKSGKQKLIFYPSKSTHDLVPFLYSMQEQGGSSRNDVDHMLRHMAGEQYEAHASHDQTFIMEKHIEDYEQQIEKDKDKYTHGDQQQDWLNKMSTDRIESIFDATSYRGGVGQERTIEDTRDISSHNNSKMKNNNPFIYSSEERILRSLFCLIIELPFSPHPILFEEKVYTGVTPHYPPSTLAQMMPVGCGVVIEKDNDKTESKEGSVVPSTILEFSLLGGLPGPQNVYGGTYGGTSSFGGSSVFTGASLCVIADWDMDQENLAEQQYRCLAHHILRGKLDPSVKPGLEDKIKIDKILNATGTHMVFEEMDLLYKFRYFLTENKKALIKFLLSVDWTVESEVSEVPTLLSQWKKRSPIDISDALRLLGKEKAFQNAVVRQHAVETLRLASDEELLSFLLQLVQALRYELPLNIEEDSNDNTANRINEESGYQIPSSSFSSSFAWTGLSMSSSNFRNTNSQNTVFEKKNPNLNNSNVIGHHGAGLVSPLAQFLIDRACASPILANFLYWYLKVESEDQEPQGLLFKQIFESFLIQLASFTSVKINTSVNDGKQVIQGAECAVQLYALNEYIKQITECHTLARSQSGRKDVKQAALRRLLTEQGLQNIPGRIEGVPYPLNPHLQIQSLDPASATMFASAVYPCVIEFTCIESVSKYINDDRISPDSTEIGTNSTGVSTSKNVSNPNPDIRVSNPDSRVSNPNLDIRVLEHSGVSNTVTTNASVSGSMTKNALLPVDKSPLVIVKLMFKSGDDLRQDQLVMQMITLMDHLLRKVNLDLKLLTYGILAIGPNDGLMEFVPGSSAISAILKEYKSILNFLRFYNSNKYDTYGISSVVIDTFIKSCAASCVVSYILGIGDRHLDNIMMKTNGQIFHIDYGYSFFQDPKPVQPPPFRFTRHMADAMGGEDSEHYNRFKIFCCQAFNWLRKSADLILNLLSLMGDAGIMDLTKRSDLPKVLAKMEERFRLDLTDEQAEQFFVGLINESLNAIAPRLMEFAHQIAVSRR